MKYIDLHVHSLFSDGTCTPEELVDKASAQGLVAFALTDHDTVGGVDRALAAAKDKHLQVIPGVELSCEYQITPTRSKEIHILGYNIDWKQKELLDTLEAVAKERDDRNKKMCENLQKAGYPIDYDSLIERFGNTILTIIYRMSYAATVFAESRQCIRETAETTKLLCGNWQTTMVFSSPAAPITMVQTNRIWTSEPAKEIYGCRLCSSKI